MSEFPKTLGGGRIGWGTIFLASLLIHFCLFLAGWNHSLLEHQSYRQSQTAMAVEYMIHDHAWINYMTPVLGPPWQVPMEFPLYQMIVAGLCILLHSPIDQTGRVVSLLFFYASLWSMNLFLRYLVPEKKFRLMIVSLVLLAPVYIYFSRAVLIESTALFFGFGFLALNARQMSTPSPIGMVAMLASGSLCALVKITTFCAFCFPCLILPVLEWMRVGEVQDFSSRKSILQQAGVLLPGFVVPLLAGAWWTHRADAIKLASPATEELTSAALSSWNFGTWTQRLDPQAWIDLSVRISFDLTFWPLLLGVLAVIFFVPKDNRIPTGLLLLSAFIPVLVFFNLHVVHDYYFYASAVFLIFAIGYLLACLMRSGNKWGNLSWSAMAAAFLLMYGFFTIQSRDDQDAIIPAVVKVIDENSAEGDSLLIYGEVWDSRIPYHAKRKAFMNYFFGEEAIRGLDAKMEKIAGWEKIRLAIVNTRALPMQPYLQERLSSLGFSEKPDFLVEGFSIYRKKADR